MLVLLSDLELEKIAVTPVLLLRVVEALDPSLFGSGVNLCDYYRTDAEEEAASDLDYEHFQMTSDWQDAWLNVAREDWLDAMAEVLIKPPPAWRGTVDEEFGYLFWDVAGRFPDRAAQVLSLLFSDPKLHPRLAVLNELRPAS